MFALLPASDYLCSYLISKIEKQDMFSKIFPLIMVSMLLLGSCHGKQGNGESASGNRAQTLAEATATARPAATGTADSTAAGQDTAAAAANNMPEAEPVYEIYTTEGTITIMLYNDTPLHRDNFDRLVAAGYYDSVLFHRVIPDFMIQTGDPYTKDKDKSSLYGTGGPGYTIPAEIRPGHTHKRGAIAAARLGDTANPARESSGSQFYIVHNENYCSHLNGEYTVFGETIDGFDVIDRIASIPTRNDRPVKDVRIITIQRIL